MTDHAEIRVGLMTLWAIGVGSCLGGDFFGWQFILYGGFYSAMIAVIFTSLFFWFYAAAITELAARYKTSGGAYDFTFNVLGNKYAALMGVLTLLKLLLANCALCLAISSYLMEMGMPAYLQLLCWLLTYTLFTVLDSFGLKTSATLQFAVTLLCVCILAFYTLSSLTHFTFHHIQNQEVFRDSFNGFFKGLPFSLQFFDGFEELPLIMSYAKNPAKNIPRSLSLTFVTITTIAVSMVISSSGIASIKTLMKSTAPLMEGITTVYGLHTFISDTIAVLIVLGLLVNFYAFVLFSSQQIQAIASSNQLPSFLAYRHPVSGSPIVASIVSSSIGLVVTGGFVLVFGVTLAQDVLVTASLLPAVIQYVLLLECVVVVRQTEADSVDSKKEFALTSVTLPHDTRVNLGYDPAALRYSYPPYTLRCCQFMCLLFVVGLIVLASENVGFFHGIVVLLLFGVCLFAYIMTMPGSRGISHLPISKVEEDTPVDNSTISEEEQNLPFLNRVNGVEAQESGETVVERSVHSILNSL